MYKKLITLLLFILLFNILFSGCLENNIEKKINYKINYNSAPVPVISAPDKGYFGEIIEFDASSSYDIDGKIQSYNWNFGDNVTSLGVKTSHLYTISNYSNQKYPINFSVVLTISDDNGSWEYTTHKIKIAPKNYILYFNHHSLVNTKPTQGKESIKASLNLFKFNQLDNLEYEAGKQIHLQPCDWNATIFIEKTKFSFISRIRLILYDINKNIISEKELKLNFLNLWNEKTISINGKIANKVEFKSIRIFVYGFSLREKIKIVYGNNKPSSIYFNFY